MGNVFSSAFKSAAACFAIVFVVLFFQNCSMQKSEDSSVGQLAIAERDASDLISVMESAGVKPATTNSTDLVTLSADSMTCSRASDGSSKQCTFQVTVNEIK